MRYRARDELTPAPAIPQILTDVDDSSYELLQKIISIDEAIPQMDICRHTVDEPSLRGSPTSRLSASGPA